MLPAKFWFSFDSGHEFGIVVHGEDHRFRHRSFLPVNRSPLR
jgi:hypothetical protein